MILSKEESRLDNHHRATMQAEDIHANSKHTADEER
jgi:hypothetical protein